MSEARTSSDGTPPLPSRLLDSVAEELLSAAVAAPDVELAMRLANAARLVSWVRAQLAVDPGRTAALLAEIDRLAAARPQLDDTAELAGVVHRLLTPVAESGPDAGTPGGESPKDRDLSAAEITGYLRAREAGSNDEALSVRVITGGFSKRTLLVSARLGGREQDIVLRQVPAGRSSRSLRPEFDVLHRVHGAGLPAPEPLWIEPENNTLGGPFLVTRRSPGSNVGDVWGADGATREVCDDVAQIYARLHGLDVEALHTPVSPRSSPDELNEMISWQEGTLARRGITVEPVLRALLQWLRAHIPPAPARRCLIHGDAAFSNLLVDGGRVSAVLDWEAAHVGDAAEELAYLRPSVEPVLPWADFLDRYVAAGGTPPDPAATHFFEVWMHVWRHIGCLWMAQNYDASGRYAAAVAAYVHGPRFLAEGAAAAFGAPSEADSSGKA